MEMVECVNKIKIYVLTKERKNMHGICHFCKLVVIFASFLPNMQGKKCDDCAFLMFKTCIFNI